MSEPTSSVPAAPGPQPPPAGATRLVFPCSFPIKATGRAEGDFAAVVAAIVHRHAPGFAADAVTERASSGGKWLAVTVTIEAQSQAQLDAIYRDLTADPRVVWAL